MSRKTQSAAGVAGGSQSPARLSPGALGYFLELAADASNWSGSPLIGGNVEQTKERDGFLTALKRAGLVKTDQTRERIEGRNVVHVWASFTEDGKTLAAQHGRDLSWIVSAKAEKIPVLEWPASVEALGVVLDATPLGGHVRFRLVDVVVDVLGMTDGWNLWSKAGGWSGPFDTYRQVAESMGVHAAKLEPSAPPASISDRSVKSPPSLADIRRRAGKFVEVTCEPGDDCYRATCLPGFAFESGQLHEILGVFGFSPSKEDRENARFDLFERLPRSGPVAVPCVAPVCDWCSSFRRESSRGLGNDGGIGFVPWSTRTRFIEGIEVLHNRGILRTTIPDGSDLFIIGTEHGIYVYDEHAADPVGPFATSAAVVVSIDAIYQERVALKANGLAAVPQERASAAASEFLTAASVAFVRAVCDVLPKCPVTDYLEGQR